MRHWNSGIVTCILFSLFQVNTAAAQTVEGARTTQSQIPLMIGSVGTRISGTETTIDSQVMQLVPRRQQITQEKLSTFSEEKMVMLQNLIKSLDQFCSSKDDWDMVEPCVKLVEYSKY